MAVTLHSRVAAGPLPLHGMDMGHGVHPRPNKVRNEMFHHVTDIILLFLVRRLRSNGNHEVLCRVS